MKTSRSCLAGFATVIVGAILFGATRSPAAAAPAVSPSLETLLDRAAPGDEISVIVRFAFTVDLRQVREREKSARRSGIVRSLQQNYTLHISRYERFLRDRGARRIVPLWIINGMAVIAPAAAIRDLAEQPGVASIRLDSSVPGPQPTPGKAAPAEWNLDRIRAPELWSMGVTGAGVVIANVDTGVDPDHPAYKDLWRGGSNSWYDPFGEYDAPHDNTTGHGTQVNGILVGSDIGGSAIGVAPGAQWIAARIFDDDNRSSISAIHLALQWLLDPDGNPATDDAPDIVNNSWGLRDQIGQCVPEFTADVQALRAAGIAVVCAAGNEGPAPSSDLSPANYPESLSVGSVDGLLRVEPTGSRGPSSCGGRLYPWIVAPGVDVRTTDLTFGGLLPDSYVTVSGSSYSAPHVAGAMALLLGAFPNVSMDQLETILEYTAADLGPRGPDYDYGYGLIDLMAAYRHLKQYTAADPKRFLLYR